MSGIETAIRNALNKSDRSDAGVRARIYQSARNAVDAGLRKQGISDPRAVAAQHKVLDRLIEQIEAEEQARLQPAVPENLLDMAPDPRNVTPAAAPSIDAPAGGTSEAEAGDLGGMSAERLDNRQRGARQAQPEVAAGPRRTGSSDVGEKRRKRRGAGVVASLLVYGLLLAALGGGGWWFLQSGLIDDVKAVMDGERPQQQTSAPPPDSGGSDAQFRGLRTLDPRNGFGDDWVDVVKPGDSSAIGGTSGATVEAVSTGDGPAMRISSTARGDTGGVEIVVPEALLQEMSGKASTIAFTLQSASNTPVQVAVECDFSSLGHCGRHRFTVNHDKTDILVHVVFDRTMAPGTPGRLRLTADLDGKGRGVNLFAVRILPGQ